MLVQPAAHVRSPCPLRQGRPAGLGAAACFLPRSRLARAAQRGPRPRPGGAVQPSLPRHAHWQCSSSKRPDAKGAPSTPQPAWSVAGLVGTRLYLAVELAELVILLALTDAAYSGDWSRIGVISTHTELILQKIVLFIGVAHLGTGGAAGWLAARDGRPWVVPAIKGFLFGALGLQEQLTPPADGRGRQ